MTCSEAANELLKATGWIDLQSRFKFLSAAKNERKNVKNTTETTRRRWLQKRRSLLWKIARTKV
jgi:hypothetical protein